MILISGSYNARINSFRMHSPEFPYNTTTYIGYSLSEMKKKFRADNGLKGKHIEWILVGDKFCETKRG